jgi:hypothetical protein
MSHRPAPPVVVYSYTTLKYRNVTTAGMPTTTIIGDCNVYVDGSRESHQRGRMLTVVKPDVTRLHHELLAVQRHIVVEGVLGGDVV